MKSDGTKEFECSMCGLCCRNIGGIEQLINFNDGKGVCIHLTKDNLCDIYPIRPVWCNVEELYVKMFADKISYAEWIRVNCEVCEKLMFQHKAILNKQIKKETIMKFWTIQSNAVVNIIENDGIYKPDFAKSKYVLKNNNLKDLYYFLLNSFNKINKVEANGVVFGFAKVQNNSMVDIVDFNEFVRFMKSKRDVINTLDCFRDNVDNYKVLELQYKNNTNLLPLDYNDWQIIMPPYNCYVDDVKDIKNCLKNGVFHSSSFPSGIIQVHVSQVTKCDILNIYDLFKL
jgi:Fe-S-cluster containining protein